MGNISRRQFLGSASASTLALWQAGPLIVAQPVEPRDPVLDHVIRESARIYKDIQDRGLRGEHLRAFSANIQLAAIQGRQQGLDNKIRRAARSANRNRTDSLNRLEGTAGFEHQKHELERHFPDLKGLDLDPNPYGRRSRAAYERGLDVAIAGRAFSEAHNQLAQLTSGIRAELELSLAANDGVLYPGDARIVRVQMGTCELRRTALEIYEIVVETICFLTIFDPLLMPPCLVMFFQLQVSKYLMHIVCGR